MIFLLNSAPSPVLTALLIFSVNSVIRSRCVSCMLMLKSTRFFCQKSQSSSAAYISSEVRLLAILSILLQTLWTYIEFAITRSINIKKITVEKMKDLIFDFYPLVLFLFLLHHLSSLNIYLQVYS